MGNLNTKQIHTVKLSGLLAAAVYVRVWYTGGLQDTRTHRSPLSHLTSLSLLPPPLPFFISSPLCHNLSLFHPKAPSLTRLSPPSSHLSHSPLSHSSHLFLPYRMQALRPVVARQLPQKHFALLMERAHRVPSSTQTVPAEHQQAALLSNWHRNHQAARVKINKRQIQIQVEIYAELLKSADQDDSSMSSWKGPVIKILSHLEL